MDLKTILRFQLGFADAVEAVARNRASFFVGIALVLLTGIARNYDQNYFLESSFWLLGPLIFSFFSGTFLFLVLYRGFISRHLDDSGPSSRGSQWLRFMALFWMTAPVAWLYAIPVERLFSSYHAAQANLILLAIVSLWRVLLMARIVSVLQQIHFIRAIAWVLVPACLEILIVVFFGGISGRRIMAAMSGMRNAPEQDMLIAALNNAFTGAFVLLVLVAGALSIRKFRGTVLAFPEPMPGRLPAVLLGSLAVIWIGISIPSQFEQQRFVTHARLIEQGDYRESVDCLARYTRSDFPPSRRIEPDPFEYRVFRQLPKVMAVLKAEDPEWIRRLYLGHMEALFRHRWYTQHDPSNFSEMYRALERLPERGEWIDRNRTNMWQLKWLVQGSSPDTREAQAQQQLFDILLRLGVDPGSVTNNRSF